MNCACRALHSTVTFRKPWPEWYSLSSTCIICFLERSGIRPSFTVYPTSDITNSLEHSVESLKECFACVYYRGANCNGDDDGAHGTLFRRRDEEFECLILDAGI
jgi:hypothetical protein